MALDAKLFVAASVMVFATLWLYSHGRKVRYRSQPLLVVDAGSGSTRAKVYWRDRMSRLRQLEVHEYMGRKDKWVDAKIVDVLVKRSETDTDAWIQAIAMLIESTSSRAAIIGATGGLRSAEAKGDITPAMVASLRERLRALAPKATLRTLSGEDEARAELAAVQHVASSLLPLPVGMVSGGGMTSQVGFHAAGLPTVLSIVVDVNGAVAAMLHADLATRLEALAAFESALAQQVATSGRAGTLSGTFVVIEMPGALGSASQYEGRFASLAQRIGHRRVPKHELVSALKEHLDGWKADARPLAHRYDAYAALLPAELLGLSALMTDDAQFYVCRDWETGVPGEIVRPDWALGMVTEDGGL